MPINKSATKLNSQQLPSTIKAGNDTYHEQKHPLYPSVRPDQDNPAAQDMQSNTDQTQTLVWFRKIHNALIKGQRNLLGVDDWYSKYIKENPNVSATTILQAINAYANEGHDETACARTALALALANQKVAKSITDQALANHVIEFAFDKSNIFCRTQTTGIRIWRAKTLTTFFNQNGYEVEAKGVGATTRMGKIYKELGMPIPEAPANTHDKTSSSIQMNRPNHTASSR